MEPPTNPKNDPLAEARERLIAFLNTRPRSVEEARARLQRAGFASTVVEDVLDDAKERGWLNDAAFAKLWIEDRLMSNPKGPKLLRYELREKGVDDAYIQQALDEADIDEAALVRQLIDRQMPRYGREGRESRKRKLVGYLQRRGFNYRVIRDALAEIDLDNPDS